MPGAEQDLPGMCWMETKILDRGQTVPVFAHVPRSLRNGALITALCATHSNTRTVWVGVGPAQAAPVLA